MIIKRSFLGVMIFLAMVQSYTADAMNNHNHISIITKQLILQRLSINKEQFTEELRSYFKENDGFFLNKANEINLDDFLILRFFEVKKMIANSLEKISNLSEYECQKEAMRQVVESIPHEYLFYLINTLDMISILGNTEHRYLTKLCLKRYMDINEGQEFSSYFNEIVRDAFYVEVLSR